MAEGKKGFIAKIFGSKKPSCCCNIEIEEVPEDQGKDTGGKNQAQQGQSCCDPSRNKKK